MDTKSLEKKSVNEVDFAEASYDQQVLKSDDNKVEILGRLQELILEKVGVELTPEEPFETMALDSLRAVELETRISDEFDLDLAPSMLTPDSNLLRLAEHICACKADEPAPTKKPTQRTAEKVLSYRERLASHREQVAQMITNDVMCYGLAQDGMVSPVSIMLNNRELIVFSSYSYLGLNLREEVLEAKKAALTKFGSGSHAVMLLGGRTNVHVSLKDRLVENFQGDDAILFSSGYSANMGVIDSLMGEDGMIFCDMLVHTSILDGCRISGADVHMFPHQDADALDRMLGRRPAGTPALVIVDGVYSLRGAIANLPNILEVAHKHGALLMVDEAHALGAIGPGGRGTAAHFGLNGKVDITTGGLGKGIPAYGGYVVADRELIDYLRFRSRPYVYSGGMDVANAAAALRAMELMESEPALMDKLNRNIAVMDQALVDAGIPCLRWGSPCMPVVCRNDKEAYALSREMMRRGYYIAPITYPAVPKDQQGLRLTVTAAHEPEQILRVVEELAEVMKSFS